MFRILAIVAALIVWSIGSYIFVFMFAGTNVCSIMQHIPNSPGATPMPVDYAARAAACSSPDLGGIVVSVAGYVVIAAVAIMARPERPTANP